MVEARLFTITTAEYTQPHGEHKTTQVSFETPRGEHKEKTLLILYIKWVGDLRSVDNWNNDRGFAELNGRRERTERNSK